MSYLVLVFSAESMEAFKNWTQHDDKQETFCEIDGKFIYFMVLFPSVLWFEP